MRVTLTIDDRIWKDAGAFAPGRTQRELIEGALYEFIRAHRPERLAHLTHITPLFTTTPAVASRARRSN